MTLPVEGPPAAARPNGRDLIEVDDLVTYYPVRGGVLQRTVGWVQAVDGVTFGSGRARRSAWSGSRAAARRPSGGRCCG
jgi:ABC-type microcin C transport system duplicated ATPase subunit YejF